MGCIRSLQAHSTRGWAYRQGQGWIFDTLTPDELAVFQSDSRLAPHTDLVCFPNGAAVIRLLNGPCSGLKNWFVYCTLTRVHESALARFQIQQVGKRDLHPLFNYSLGPSSYEAWLWADEIAICRELGCEIAEHDGWGWDEWEPPAMLPPRAWYKEHTFIYALADPLTEQVRYVGKADDPEQRLLEHLRDTGVSDKVQWIRSLGELGYTPVLLILEEVSNKAAPEREYYWTVYYYDRGHSLTNAVCAWWKEAPDMPENGSYRHRRRVREPHF